MKTIGVSLVILFGSIVFMTSCQKCHVCIAKDQDGVQRYQYPEMCGTKKELSSYADQCETEYGKYDYTCACGESL
jgi:hypothetical protein